MPEVVRSADAENASEIDLSVVVPVFNGADFVADRLRYLTDYLDALPYAYEVIAVDDGSTDDTRGALEGLLLPHLRVARLPSNRGKFAAVARGMALTRGRCCLFLDADVPFDLDVIDRMHWLVRQRGFHVVVGDRTLDESHYADELPAVRRVATRAFAWLLRLSLTGELYDTQCGIKAFRGDVARALFPMLVEDGFVGDVEALYVCLKYNLAIRRVPVRLAYQAPSTVRTLRDGLPMFARAMRLPQRFREGAYRSPTLAEAARDGWQPPAEAESR